MRLMDMGTINTTITITMVTFDPSHGSVTQLPLIGADVRSSKHRIGMEMLTAIAPKPGLLLTAIAPSLATANSNSSQPGYC